MQETRVAVSFTGRDGAEVLNTYKVFYGSKVQQPSQRSGRQVLRLLDGRGLLRIDGGLLEALQNS